MLSHGEDTAPVCLVIALCSCSPFRAAGPTAPGMAVTQQELWGPNGGNWLRSFSHRKRGAGCSPAGASLQSGNSIWPKPPKEGDSPCYMISKIILCSGSQNFGRECFLGSHSPAFQGYRWALVFLIIQTLELLVNRILPGYSLVRTTLQQKNTKTKPTTNKPSGHSLEQSG